MTQAKRLLDRALGGALVVLMGVSVVNVLWQVFTRFVLGSPSSFTEELARFLLIWIGVLGAGYAVGQRDHLALKLVPEHLSGRAYEAVQIAIQACIALFAVPVMVVGGARLVFLQLSLGQVSASLGLPIGYVYLALPLSGAAMTFYAAAHAAGHWRAWRGGGGPGPAAQNGPAAPRRDGSATEGGGL